MWMSSVNTLLDVKLEAAPGSKRASPSFAFYSVNQSLFNALQFFFPPYDCD